MHLVRAFGVAQCNKGYVGLFHCQSYMLSCVCGASAICFVCNQFCLYVCRMKVSLILIKHVGMGSASE